MAPFHALAAAHFEWAVIALSLFAGVLQRRGFGGRSFGRRRGSFRLVRVLFVLLFTTVLGPIVLVALLALAAYWFFASRRRR